MGRGIGHLPSPDEAVPPVDAGMAFVTEDRDGYVGVMRAVLVLARLAEHQRPARMAVLLAQLRRPVLPIVGDAARFDLCLLGRTVALLRRRDQAGIDNLARHGDVAGLIAPTERRYR